jgi:hypothetical protein
MEQGQAVSHKINLCYTACLLLLAGSIVIPTNSFALDLSFPGYSWAELRYPNSPIQEERTNFSAEGDFEQGIDWIRLNDHITVNTFAQFRYTVDTAGLDYNNRIVPAIGAQFKVKVGTGIVQVGLKAEKEYRWKTDQSSGIVLGFANYWFGWNLGGK